MRSLGIAERKEVEHKQAEGFDMVEEEANTAEGGDMTYLIIPPWEKKLS